MNTRPRSGLPRAAVALAIAAVAAGVAVAGGQSTAGITLAVLSSRADMVSGDDALVELRTGAPGAGPGFPGGVCDFSKPGIGQQAAAGTYLTLPLRR